MTHRKRASLLLAVAAVVAASCSKIEPITAPALAPGSADFSVVAALGGSITAGFQSGGLVSRHQTHSYAVLFAQQVGAHALDLPLVGGDGLPPLLQITNLYPPPIQIGPISSNPGDVIGPAPATAYHNLGIPGARVQDVFDATNYKKPPRDVFFRIVQRDSGTLARQVATKLDPRPTFLLFEYGSSELLGPALNGTTAGVTTVGAFADSFGRAVDTLLTLLPDVKLAVLNVPDVTGLPFFTTVSNMQLDANGQPVLDANGRPKFLLGPQLDANSNNLPLTANDRVLLSAQSDVANGYGYPAGTFSYLSGKPVAGRGAGLKNDQVLLNTEVLLLQDRTRKFNAVIVAAAEDSYTVAVSPVRIRRKRDFAIVDLKGLFEEAVHPGIVVRGVLYTSDFVYGGLFSLDGVSPNDLCQALLCNEVIRTVNEHFESNIQPLDALKFATPTASRAGGPRPEGRAP